MMTPLNTKINPEKYKHPNQIKKIRSGHAPSKRTLPFDLGPICIYQVHNGQWTGTGLDGTTTHAIF
jgi:hypothetical protein